MTNEEMAAFLDHRSDTSNDVHAAIARRIRLLGAVAATGSQHIALLRRGAMSMPVANKLAQNIAALDADERGEVANG